MLDARLRITGMYRAGVDTHRLIAIFIIIDGTFSPKEKSASFGLKIFIMLKQRRDLKVDPYLDISFSVIESTGRPGTPHRNFHSSHAVEFDSPQKREKDSSYDVTNDDENVKDQTSLSIASQVVHRHLNGLCVVTVGNTLDSSLEIQSVDFLRDSNEGTARSKRKRKMKMTHASEGDNSRSSSVTARDPVARVTLKDGSRITLRCCVNGQLIELNNRLLEHPSLLTTDPLQDGYIGIIVPFGGFPPSSCFKVGEQEKQQSLEETN